MRLNILAILFALFIAIWADDDVPSPDEYITKTKTLTTTLTYTVTVALVASATIAPPPKNNTLPTGAYPTAKPSFAPIPIPLPPPTKPDDNYNVPTPPKETSTFVPDNGAKYVVGSKALIGAAGHIIKHKGTDKEYKKSRLVLQAYNDKDKETVLTQSPTLQRVSQRIILSIAAILRMNLYLRDITQAYVQSVTKLSRDFYIRAPKEMSPENKILKKLKPLYANEKFAKKEDHKLKESKLIAKEREILTTTHALKFNGSYIHLEIDLQSINLSQEIQCNNLNLIELRPADISSTRSKIRKSLSPRDQYVAQRARGAYIAT
ncbi:hypothetical protein EPUL_005760, partial [Erysiphe pulchra]